MSLYQRCCSANLFVALASLYNCIQINCGRFSRRYVNCCAYGKVEHPHVTQELDGMQKRFNKTLKKQLALFVQQQKDWDVQVPLLPLAYWMAKQVTTKFKPPKLG